MKEIKRRMDESAEAFAERCEEMAETKGMTADDIALAILQDCPDATRIGGMRQKIALAVTQAEECGRVEMREKCAQIADHEENTMRARISSGPYDAAYLDGYADGAHGCGGFIRALPTSPEGQSSADQQAGQVSSLYDQGLIAGLEKAFQCTAWENGSEVRERIRTLCQEYYQQAGQSSDGS